MIFATLLEWCCDLEKGRVRWWHSLSNCGSPTTDGEGSSSARAEFGSDRGITGLNPLRHPAAFALSRTAVARGMMMPVWIVLDASSRFRNRFMRNSLKMAGASRYH